MIITKKIISRREVLRGFGAMVALPLLPTVDAGEKKMPEAPVFENPA